MLIISMEISAIIPSFGLKPILDFNPNVQGDEPTLLGHPTL
jgi:hypothetical protein